MKMWDLIGFFYEYFRLIIKLFGRNLRMCLSWLEMYREWKLCSLRMERVEEWL